MTKKKDLSKTKQSKKKPFDNIHEEEKYPSSEEKHQSEP
jgi:hypothetical protein